MAYTWQDDTEMITAEQQSGEASLRIERKGWLSPYTDIPTFMFDVLGGYIVSGGYLLYVPAMRHPLIPWARAVSVKTEPFETLQYTTAGDITGYLGLMRYGIAKNPATGSTGKARVTIEYELPTLDQQAIDNNTGGQGGQGGSGGNDSKQEMAIASENWEIGAQNITIPKWFHKFKFSQGPKRQDEYQVAKLVPHCEVTLVRHRCLELPFLTASALAGTINQTDFTLGRSVIAPPGTVRFDGMGASRKLTTSQGFPYFEVTYKFKVRLGVALVIQNAAGVIALQQLTWNHVPNWEKSVANAEPVWEELVPSVYSYAENQLPPFTQPNGEIVNGLQHLFRRDAD